MRKAIDIYWRLTIGTIKILFSIALSVIGIGAFFLLWTIVHLYL